MNFFLKKTTTLFVLTAILADGFLLASCGKNARKGYRIENGEVVLYTGFPANRRVVGKADAGSFTALNDEYGKDKNRVFYLGRSILNADPTTFTYLAGSYSKDKNRGYSRDQLISNEGANFSIVPNPNETPANGTAEGIAYAHDSRRVYKDVIPIDGADPATFAFVPMFNGNYLTHDRRWVYFNDRPLEGVDGATFRKVSDFHFNDKHGAWGLVLGRDTYWSPIAKVDIATFSSIGNYYAKDKKRVYFSNYAVKGADPNTFKETAYLQGQDKNGNYSSGYGNGRPGATDNN